MVRPLIVVFLGLPGSGKTTFARQLAAHINAVTLSSDAIRLSMYKTREAAQVAREENRTLSNQLIFGALNYGTRQIIRAGGSVLFDAVVSHRHERQEKYDIANEFGAQAVLVRISVPREVAIARMQQRIPTEDQRQFTLEKAIGVYDHFASDLEEPTSDEPTIYIDGELSFDEQLKIFLDKLSMLQ